MNHLILGKISSNFSANTKNNSVRFFQKAHSFSWSVSKADEQNFDDENNEKQEGNCSPWVTSVVSSPLMAIIWSPRFSFPVKAAAKCGRTPLIMMGAGADDPRMSKPNVPLSRSKSTSISTTSTVHGTSYRVNIERVDKPFQIESQWNQAELRQHRPPE